MDLARITPAEAYAAIRDWMRSPAMPAVAAEVNARRAEMARLGLGVDPLEIPHALVAVLPANPSDLEIKAVLREVIVGKLEFACGATVDGHTLHAIAHAGVGPLSGYTFTDAEWAQIHSSPLFPHLSKDR